jgi:pimeloyl-ACP methyl ester carboxylesterase
MTSSFWNGFQKLELEFKGRKAILVFPHEKNKTSNWMLKTEYFGAFPNLEIEMLKRGWHLAYIANITRWCLDEDLDLKKEFAEFLNKEYGLNKKCVPVGMSCGGMIAVKFAAKYPEYVSCLYLDAPVMNLLSCPCGIGDATADLYQEFVTATGKNRSDLINYREHPVDKIPALLEHKLPVVLVYGDADTVVPYYENGIVLENYYKENGGTILAIGKEGCGHHPHGLEDSTQIIKFIEEHFA